MTLDELCPGVSAEILNIDCDPATAGRLADMGLTPGTSVQCLYASPLGDPTAYLIRGAVIAIRRRDGRKITVRWQS